MTSPQLSELIAFWQIEGGWGEWKQDYRFGHLCSVQANINRDPKKRTQPYSSEDFALRPKMVGPVDEKAELKRIRAALDTLAAVQPGKKKKKRNGKG